MYQSLSEFEGVYQECRRVNYLSKTSAVPTIWAKCFALTTQKFSEVADRHSLARQVGTALEEKPYREKPGPGSIAEALAMGLPVIVERNAWTLPQERYNASWVREKQVGLVVSNFNTVADAVAQLLEKETFAQFRCNARKMRNRALFEIPDVLSRILQESNRGDGALPQGLSRDL